MAGISTSIQMVDQMTPVIQSITNAMNLMVSGFYTAQSVTSAAFDTAPMAAMQQEVANTSAELARYQQELERVQNTQVNVPEPTWSSAATPQVFMNSGADRFADEMQSANQMAQQLFQTQRQISAQARSLRVTPPGMLNDVAAVENRIQSLASRIQQLDDIPINLRTNQTNNELENLRRNLVRAVDTQESLNQAMSRMDISAANAAYQQLNDIVSSTEQRIRDNLSMQEQFNQSLEQGHTAASRLEQGIKRAAAVVASVATAKHVIGLADEVAQTTSRLNLMNQRFDETGNLHQRIYESAQRSRGVYQVTADAVSKLGMQASGAFANTDEMIAFAEQLNKNFVIAGTSAQGVDSVMLQLTQAMAAGKLQGEELNAVLDNAQPIVQHIADYMGVPVGKIKELAADGAISAEIIKNAMFAAADETNAKFEQMPMRFSQVATSIQNQTLMAFQPALQQLSAVAQTAGFQTFVSSVTSGIQTMAQAAVTGVEMMTRAAVWAQENWWWLAPVIAGVIAAVVAYKGAVIAYNVVQSISNGLKMASVATTALQETATLKAAAANIAEATSCSAATASQWAFNASLLACPLTWIVLAIMAVVVAIAIWINHVGGLRIAWMICVNAVLTAGERLQLGFMFMGMMIQNTLSNAQYAFAAVKVGILNALSLMKVGGLQIVESFLNGVIDRINSLIQFVNQIPGISIQTLEQVELVTNAKTEEMAKVKQRAADLAAMREENSAAEKARRQEYVWQKLKADEAAANRQWEINQARNASKNRADNDAAYGGYAMEATAYEDIAANTAGNTAAMADSMDLLEEDLKYMRDAAEQEIINRFTLAELKVDVNNNNTLKTQTDFADVNRMLGDVTAEILAAAAEGGGHV